MALGLGPLEVAQFVFLVRCALRFCLVLSVPSLSPVFFTGCVCSSSPQRLCRQSPLLDLNALLMPKLKNAPQRRCAAPATAMIEWPSFILRRAASPRRRTCIDGTTGGQTSNRLTSNTQWQCAQVQRLPAGSVLFSDLLNVLRAQGSVIPLTWVYLLECRLRREFLCERASTECNPAKPAAGAQAPPSKGAARFPAGCAAGIPMECVAGPLAACAAGIPSECAPGSQAGPDARKRGPHGSSAATLAVPLLGCIERLARRYLSW